MTSRLVLEYDGTHFAGWARQPGQRSVRDEVERALRTVLREPEVSLTVAGRTDAGVHAWGQVCSYEHEAVDPLRLNALLPKDVAVLDSNPAADGFDARRDALSRTYCYRLLHRRARSVWLDGRALWHGWKLDRDALDACARAIGGTHDFTAFTPKDSYHRRFERDVHSAQWRADGDLLEFWITADSFMRHMNRVLVGTMLEVATSRRALEDFEALLTGRPRSHAGPTAPARGLALASVSYADVAVS
ncbi:MAG: tRNA pseudouridine38-40 synthase [Solirubrobacteraceae bacterium]|jgi:tRNA pseudouridine38-40 synthase|nr:tRNA pseudouridine38-40 synthase [Solirubrobacteraceae bacterium]